MINLIKLSKSSPTPNNHDATPTKNDAQTPVKFDKKFVSFDYLLIAQDTAYVIVENARKLLAPLDANDVHYIGRPVKKSYLDTTFNALDSTIVISRGAIKFLTSNYYTNMSVCNDKVFNINDAVN